MRKICGVLFGLAWLAGCATTNTNLPDIKSGSYEYKLLAVQGYGLPHKVTMGDLQDREVVAGQLFLKSDNTFELRTTQRVQMSALEPFVFEREFTGTYETSRIGLQLNWSGGAITSGAFWGPNALRMYLNGIEYIFVK